LDRGGIDQNRCRRKTAAQRDQHVAQGCARRRRDDADAPRQRGDRAFACRVEQALGRVEVTSILLLAAIVGAVVLAKRRL
jgi:hypothetical protein